MQKLQPSATTHNPETPVPADEASAIVRGARSCFHALAYPIEDTPHTNPVVFVTEGVANPFLTLLRFTSHEEALAFCMIANEAMKLSREDVHDIIASSMGLHSSRTRRLQPECTVQRHLPPDARSLCFFPAMTASSRHQTHVLIPKRRPPRTHRTSPTHLPAARFCTTICTPGIATAFLPCDINAAWDACSILNAQIGLPDTYWASDAFLETHEHVAAKSFD